MKPMTPRFPKLLHGGDYNPDQWLRDPQILEQDIQLMKKAAINCVSVGIFSWAHLEPEEGIYTFDWLEEIMTRLYQNGIYTILSTPSCATPLWMSEKYEEIRSVQANGVRHLSGNRGNHCYHSPVFREKVTAIDRRLAERFSQHPGVILWHLSNEYGGECYCEICQKEFRLWLQKKYGTLDALNRAWWTDFWSHTYTDWSQIHPPVPHGETSTNGLLLDWHRFNTATITDFCRLERDTVKQVCPQLPVTTNLMGFYDGLDYFQFAPILDVVSWDSYPLWHTQDNVEIAVLSALTHDLMRSIKHEPFLLMESTPSTVNWSPVSMLKRPGMHLLSAMQALAHGSNSVQYFQFRKGRGGSEKFHGAVVDHVGDSGPLEIARTENTRVFQEVQSVGQLLQHLNQRGDLYDTTVKPEIAIVFDTQNRWAIHESSGPRNCGMGYEETILEHYRVFWEKGIQVDIVNMDGDLAGYKLVTAPMLYMLRNGFESKLRNYVANGGTLVMTYWSGIVDENDLCIPGGTPGHLMDVFGLWNEEIDALPDGYTNSLSFQGKSYTVRDFCARIHPTTAKVLGTYTTDFYAGEAAITKNSFEKGTAYYLAPRTDTALLRNLYHTLVSALGIRFSLEASLPHGVTAHMREGECGSMIFVENYTDISQTVPLKKNYLRYDNGETVAALHLPPFGAAILLDPLDDNSAAV